MHIAPDLTNASVARDYSQNTRESRRPEKHPRIPESDQMTHHSTAGRVQQERFAGSDWGQVEQQDVGDHIVDGHRRSFGVGHVLRNVVDVFGGHGHQFGPGLEFGQSDNAIANLEERIIKSRYELKPIQFHTPG